MKKIKKILLILVPFTFLGIVIYFMFRNNYQTILEQLSEANPIFLVIMAAMGIIYELLDAAVMGSLIFPKVKNLSYREMVQLTFLGVFMNITTYGTGIKPAQTYCLTKKGENPGRAFGMLTLPYVFHKATILIYATVMLLLQHRFLKESFADTFHYLLAGYLISILVIVGLVLVCASRYLNIFLCKMIGQILQNEKWKEKRGSIITSFKSLQSESCDIVRDYRIWFKMICFNMVKMTFWYVLPLIGIYTVGGSVNGITVFQIIATSAFMQLIIGVIPTAGGMVSTEVVYTLLFSRLFGVATAGTTMILFRLTTYYLPFIISIPVVLTMKMYRKK